MSDRSGFVVPPFIVCISHIVAFLSIYLKFLVLYVSFLSIYLKYPFGISEFPEMKKGLWAHTEDHLTLSNLTQSNN